MQRIYVTNTFICGSLPNELYKIGFAMSKLHASIYLALFADSYAELQCCFTVCVRHLSLYLQEKPASRAPGQMFNFECTD